MSQKYAWLGIHRHYFSPLLQATLLVSDIIFLNQEEILPGVVGDCENQE